MPCPNTMLGRTYPIPLTLRIDVILSAAKDLSFRDACARR